MQIPGQNVYMKLISMRPSHQRGVLGVTGLVMQPLVEYKNPFMEDKDTREHSAGRTTAKMIVTAGCGVATRGIGEWFGGYLIKKDKIKVPDSILKHCEDNFKTNDARIKEYATLMGKKVSDISKNDIKIQELAKIKYARAMGNILGIGACILSILTIESKITDPLTNKLLNFFYKGEGWGTDKNKGNKNKGGHRA